MVDAQPFRGAREMPLSLNREKERQVLPVEHGAATTFGVSLIDG